MTKTLVIYYSQFGHTASLAQQIAVAADADLCPVTVARGVYPDDMSATNDVFQRQVAHQHFPALTNQLPKLAAYQLLLIGGPVWDQTLAGPIISLVGRLQGFAGQVADFSSAYSATGNYEDDFQQLAARNGLTTISRGLHINGSHASQVTLQQWLKQLP